MTPSESQSLPNLPPKKTSAYSRSATFRLGVWALAAAGALILWHGFLTTLEDRSVTLLTEEGIVFEPRVARETVRDVETTRKYQRINRWKQQRSILFLLATGMPLTCIGYLLSLSRSPPAPVIPGPPSSPH